MPLPLLGAIAAGAAIGAIGGFAVYAIRTALSKEQDFSWKGALASTAGGLVGGATFPLAFAGLAAIGVPTLAAYTVAGGVTWGGLGTLTTDATSIGLGEAKHLGDPSRYLTATAIAAATTLVLAPVASSAITPRGVVMHKPTVHGLIKPEAGAIGVTKSQSEFVVHGTLTETVHHKVEGHHGDAHGADLHHGTEAHAAPTPHTVTSGHPVFVPSGHTPAEEPKRHGLVTAFSDAQTPTTQPAPKRRTTTTKPRAHGPATTKGPKLPAIGGDGF